MVLAIGSTIRTDRPFVIFAHETEKNRDLSVGDHKRTPSAPLLSEWPSIPVLLFKQIMCSPNEDFRGVNLRHKGPKEPEPADIRYTGRVRSPRSQISQRGLFPRSQGKQEPETSIVHPRCRRALFAERAELSHHTNAVMIDTYSAFSIFFIRARKRDNAR
jgi:hypothetical protein